MQCKMTLRGEKREREMDKSGKVNMEGDTITKVSGALIDL